MPSIALVMMRSALPAVVLCCSQLAGCNDSAVPGEPTAIVPARQLAAGDSQPDSFIRLAYTGAIVGAPALPREYLNTGMPAVTGRTIRVGYGDNFQSAIDDAQPGDELVLDAGVTYTGTFTLKKKAGDGWIIIRTSGALPPEGTRVTPADSPRLARLVASHAAQPVIQTEAGAHHYRLVGLEVTAKEGATTAHALVNLGDGKSSQNTIESQPHHLVLDRVYVHGTPTLNFQRCVALHTASTAVIDSWLSECHGNGFDSQAIVGWNGTGPYKIVNNRLEGAGENVMFGGADPSIPNALPSDIEIRRNHFIKPAEWKGVWSAKNLLEFKIGKRVLVEGNVFENSWLDAQIGFAINLKSTNENGKSPWGETSDITFRYNIIRNSAHGVTIAPNPQKGSAVPASRFLFEHNVFERIGTGDYKGGRLFQVTAIDDLTISHNTAISSHSFLILGNGGTSANLTVTDNIFAGSAYGLSGDGAGSGTAGLDKRAPGWIFSGNVITGAKANAYPTGNSFPASLGAVGFVDFAAGNFELLAPQPSSSGADVAQVRAMTAGVVR